jgi:hypothetical protein
VRGGVSRISSATRDKWSDVTVVPMKVCGSTVGDEIFGDNYVI